MASTYFPSQWLTQWPPNVHVARYKLLHGAFIRKQHFRPLSENPMAMTSSQVQFTGFRCGFRTGLWDLSPNSLLRRVETVLHLIAVPFKRKIAQMFMQDLFG